MDAGFGLAGGVNRITQGGSPTTGQTVAIADGASDVLLWLTPATTIATLTVQLPTDAGSFIGQDISIGSSKAVTVLTITGATTVFNPATLLNLGDLFTIKKVAANTWARKE